MACIFCLRDDFTNYSGSDIEWSYEGYSETEGGPYVKGCALEFDGVDDSVQAPNGTIFDVTTGDFDVEVKFRTTEPVTHSIRLADKRGTGSTGSVFGWQLSIQNGGTWGNVIVNNTSGVVGGVGSPFDSVPYNENDGNWHIVRLNWENSTGTATLYIDGVEAASDTDASMIGTSIHSPLPFTIGMSSNLAGTQQFEGDIEYFRFNSEEFLFEGCSGATLTGSEATILDINGATWHGNDFNPDVSGENPCFDAENLPNGYYKFSYIQGYNTGDVILTIGSPEEAGNPVSDAYCYQGDQGEPCYLNFAGSGDVVQAQNNSVFDIGTGDFDVEVEFRTNTSNQFRILDKRGTGAAGSFPSFQISPNSTLDNWANIVIDDGDGNYMNPFGSVPFNEGDGEWHTVRLTWDNSEGRLRLYINGVFQSSEFSNALIGTNLSSSVPFTVGGSSNDNGQYFEGDVRYIRFNSEEFTFEECSGPTIAGSESTELDILGPTWQGGFNIESINLQDYFLNATKYDIQYVGGSLPQFDGTNLEITTLDPGQYCFTNTANKTVPEGYDEKECVNCNDEDQICIDIVSPPNAGDDRVINVCNNGGEVYYQDFLVNNDGIGTFQILSEDLVYGSLDSEKYTPGISDYGGSFTIAHILPHPIAEVCNGIAILQFNVQNCIICPDDSGLGLTVQEEVDGGTYDDKVTATKTGTYDDPTRIESDDLYFSNDDGNTWIQADEATELDYYVRLTSGIDATCNAGAGTGCIFLENIQVTSGEPVQEAQLRSGSGNYNQDWTNITSGQELGACGSTASIVNERYYRWDVRHVLNSGWELHHTRTGFETGDPNGPVCPPGPGSGNFEVTSSGNPLGKRKIIFQRRITYNIPCEDLIIEEEFNPTLPDCDFDTSGLGFNIVDPVPDGAQCILGSVSCTGSIPGSTQDRVFVYRKYSFAAGYSDHEFDCGSSFSLDCDAQFFFIRRIILPDCPPVILLHNYQSGSTCYTAGINCEKQDSQSRARAFRSGTPPTLASDYLQYRRGSGGSWQSYSEGQWIYVSATQTLYFRRVANYNNGCSQTTATCSQTVTPPSYTITTTCQNGNTLVTNITGLTLGGTYRIYRNDQFVGLGSANYPVSSSGNYRVRYSPPDDLNYYYGNYVQCGSGGGCDDPTFTFGQCSISGNTITLPFTTSNVDNIGQISIGVTPGSGSFTWSSGSQQGTITVEGDPGQNYSFTGGVTTSCGSDSDTHNCQIGCANLSIANVNCNFQQNRTYFSVYVTPDQTTPPSVAGATYTGSQNNRYDFYVPGTSGSFTATHPNMCNSVGHTISCSCQEPTVNISMSCDNDDIYYSISVQNGQNITSNFDIYIDGAGSPTHTVTNTGASNYSGSFVDPGLSHDWEIRYTSCGTQKTPSGSIDCSCLEPSIQLQGTCNVDELSYSFTVQNESQVNGNYTIRLNGGNTGTVINTNQGTYVGVIPVTAYSSPSLQIRCTSDCSTTINSNTINPNCGCPAASISIDTISCNPANQEVTFSVNTNNATITDYFLNGSSVAGPGTYSGVVGTNTVTIEGQANCDSSFLSDSSSVNCACSANPGVQIDSMNESGGVLTVNFSTTNISTAAQIEFKGNGTIRTVTNLGSGNWRASFTLTEGSNTISVVVENECGTANDLDTYNYEACVAPSIEHVTTVCDNGYVFIYTNTDNLTHAQISTTPSSTRYGTGQNKTFRFPIGGTQTLNWSINGNNGCGTDSINGSFDNCSQTDLSISDRGCSGTNCADYLFFVDNSGSINFNEFTDFRESIRATIDQIAASGVDARYAIVQYYTLEGSPPNFDHHADVSVNFTSSAATAKNFNRAISGSEIGDWQNESLGVLLGKIGSTVNPRSGCQKHLVIFTDAIDDGETQFYSSRVTPFASRNSFVSNGWIISVVKYSTFLDGEFDTLPKLRAVSSVGGNDNGQVYSNSGDTEGSGSKPRRFYYRNSFDGLPIPGLVDDIAQNECQLRALVDGCAASPSFSWSTVGGTIISGQGTNEITTDGTGSYTVTITYNNGCQLQKTHNY